MLPRRLFQGRLDFAVYRLQFKFSKIMANKLVGYFKDSFSELGKVTWPTKDQAVLLTVIVIAFCVVFAGFLGLLDFVFGIGLEELLKLAG